MVSYLTDINCHILMGLDILVDGLAVKVLVVQYYWMDLFDPCGMHIVVSLDVASGILLLVRSNSFWSVVG